MDCRHDFHLRRLWCNRDRRIYHTRCRAFWTGRSLSNRTTLESLPTTHEFRYRRERPAYGDVFIPPETDASSPPSSIDARPIRREEVRKSVWREGGQVIERLVQSTRRHGKTGNRQYTIYGCAKEGNEQTYQSAPDKVLGRKFTGYDAHSWKYDSVLRHARSRIGLDLSDALHARW